LGFPLLSRGRLARRFGAEAIGRSSHGVDARHGQPHREDAHRAADALDVGWHVLQVLPLPSSHDEFDRRDGGHGPAREGEYLEGREHAVPNAGDMVGPGKWALRVNFAPRMIEKVRTH
jgi:hypothetical protein